MLIIVASLINAIGCDWLCGYICPCRIISCCPSRCIIILFLQNLLQSFLALMLVLHQLCKQTRIADFFLDINLPDGDRRGLRTTLPCRRHCLRLPNRRRASTENPWTSTPRMQSGCFCWWWSRWAVGALPHTWRRSPTMRRRHTTRMRRSPDRWSTGWTTRRGSSGRSWGSSPWVPSSIPVSVFSHRWWRRGCGPVLVIIAIIWSFTVHIGKPRALWRRWWIHWMTTVMVICPKQNKINNFTVSIATGQQKEKKTAAKNEGWSNL